MTKGKDTATSQNIVDFSIKGIQEKKGLDIVVINLKDIGNAIADYFVICSGNSDTHIDAIANSVEKEVYLNCRQDPWSKEGKQNKKWVLLDYVDVVIHIFSKETREFYGLEDLWGDAEFIQIDDYKTNMLKLESK